MNNHRLHIQQTKKTSDSTTRNTDTRTSMCRRAGRCATRRRRRPPRRTHARVRNSRFSFCVEQPIYIASNNPRFVTVFCVCISPPQFVRFVPLQTSRAHAIGRRRRHCRLFRATLSRASWRIDAGADRIVIVVVVGHNDECDGIGSIERRRRWRSAEQRQAHAFVAGASATPAASPSPTASTPTVAAVTADIDVDGAVAAASGVDAGDAA
jgi:hypothetical protein